MRLQGTALRLSVEVRIGAPKEQESDADGRIGHSSAAAGAGPTLASPTPAESNGHPAVRPVIEALANLTQYQPTDLADLAEVLRSLHQRTKEGLVDQLWLALRGLADWYDAVNGNALTGVAEDGSELAVELYSAAQAVAVDGGEHLDRARALVSRFQDEAREVQP